MGGRFMAGRQSPPRHADNRARPPQQHQQQQKSSATLAAAPSQEEPTSLGSAPPQSGTVPRRADTSSLDAGGGATPCEVLALPRDGSEQAGGRRAAPEADDYSHSRRLAAGAAPSPRHADGHAGQLQPSAAARTAGPTHPEATTAGGGQPGPGMGRQRADTPALDALAAAGPQETAARNRPPQTAHRPQRDTAALHTINEGAAQEVHPPVRQGPPWAAAAPAAGASVPHPRDECMDHERPAPGQCEPGGGVGPDRALNPVGAPLEPIPPPHLAAGQAAGPQFASPGADTKSSRRLMADRSSPLGRADTRAQPQQPQRNNDPLTSAPSQAEARPRVAGSFAAAAAAASAALAVGSTTPLASSSGLWHSAVAAPTPASPAATVQARLDAGGNRTRSDAQAASAAAPHQSLLPSPLQQPGQQKGQQLQLQEAAPPQKQMAAPSQRSLPPPPPAPPRPLLLPRPPPPAFEQEQPLQPQEDSPRQDPLRRLRRLISRQLGPPALTAASTLRLERTSQQLPANPPPQPSGQPDLHHTAQPPTPYSAQFQQQEPRLVQGEADTGASVQFRQQTLPTPAAAVKPSPTEQSQRRTRQQQQALPETPMSAHFQHLQQSPERQRRLTTPRSQQQQQQTLQTQHRDTALEHLSSQQQQKQALPPPQSSALSLQQQEQQQFPQQPERQQRPSRHQSPGSEGAAQERAQMHDLAVKPRLQQLLLQSPPPPPPRQQLQQPLQSLQSHPVTTPQLSSRPLQLQRPQQQSQPSPRDQPLPRQPSSPLQSAVSRSASESEGRLGSLSRTASLDKQAAVSRLRESAHRLASAVSGTPSSARSQASSGPARLLSERASPALRASSDGFSDSDGERRMLASFPVDSSGDGESSPELRTTPEVLRPLQPAALQTDGAANSTAAAALSGLHGRGSLDGARKPRMLSLMKGTPLL